MSCLSSRLVAAGEFHTCAVTAKGKLHCFGRNDYGQCNVPKDLENVIAARFAYTISIGCFKYDYNKEAACSFDM